MKVILALGAALALSGCGYPDSAAYINYRTLDAPRKTTYGEAQVYRPREMRSVRWESEAYAPRGYFRRNHHPRVVSGRDPF